MILKATDLNGWRIGDTFWRLRPDRPRSILPPFDIEDVDSELLIPAKTRHELGRAGRCIYCGATQFNEDRAKLAEEHVISEAFGAAVVLIEASCETCAGFTSATESRIISRVFDPSRKHLGIRGKKRKSLKNNYRLTTLSRAGDVDLILPSEIHPTVLLMPVLFPPAFLSPRPDIDAVEGVWAMNVNVDPSHLTKSQIDIFTSSYVDTAVFCQLLAKIAHSYAWAVLSGNFVPFHTEFIRRRPRQFESMDRYRYIGGSCRIDPATDNVHELGLGRASIEGRTIYVVRVRLFAYLEAPTYYVAIGQRLFG